MPPRRRLEHPPRHYPRPAHRRDGERVANDRGPHQPPRRRRREWRSARAPAERVRTRRIPRARLSHRVVGGTTRTRLDPPVASARDEAVAPRAAANGSRDVRWSCDVRRDLERLHVPPAPPPRRETRSPRAPPWKFDAAVGGGGTRPSSDESSRRACFASESRTTPFPSAATRRNGSSSTRRPEDATAKTTEPRPDPRPESRPEPRPESCIPSPRRAPSVRMVRTSKCGPRRPSACPANLRLPRRTGRSWRRSSRARTGGSRRRWCPRTRRARACRARARGGSSRRAATPRGFGLAPRGGATKSDGRSRPGKITRACARRIAGSKTRRGMTTATARRRRR